MIRFARCVAATVRLSGLLVTLCVAHGTLGAQCSLAPSAASRASWWPRSYVDVVNPISAADRAVIETTLGPAEALVRNTVFGKPRGFEVVPWWQYDGPRARNRLSEFRLEIQLQCPTKANGKEHPADVEMIFNPNPLRWSQGDRPILDENGDGLYFERARTAGMSARRSRGKDCLTRYIMGSGMAANLLKAEYFLPEVVNALLKEKRMRVRVLPVDEQWYGVTYPQDKEEVRAAIQQMIVKKIYPENLWGDKV